LFSLPGGSDPKAKVLLQNGADINAKGQYDATPLMMAAWCKASAEIIHLLVEYGADVYARDDLGRTVLHCGAWN
jgi:ankyrin repeat protein